MKEPAPCFSLFAPLLVPSSAKGLKQGIGDPEPHGTFELRMAAGLRLATGVLRFAPRPSQYPERVGRDAGPPRTGPVTGNSQPTAWILRFSTVEVRMAITTVVRFGWSEVSEREHKTIG